MEQKKLWDYYQAEGKSIFGGSQRVFAEGHLPGRVDFGGAERGGVVGGD